MEAESKAVVNPTASAASILTTVGRQLDMLHYFLNRTLRSFSTWLEMPIIKSDRPSNKNAFMC